MIYAATYAVLRVFLGILLLSPARNPRDFEAKWTFAEAIVEATDDLREEDVLTRIGFYESNYGIRARGDRGRSLGAFQIQPITPSDRAMATGTVFEQAKLAVAYVRRSAEACPGNVGADRLAMYVSGTCTRGIREARHRWGQD